MPNCHNAYRVYLQMDRVIHRHSCAVEKSIKVSSGERIPDKEGGIAISDNKHICTELLKNRGGNFPGSSNGVEKNNLCQIEKPIYMHV